VLDISTDRLDDPDVVASFGATMVELTKEDVPSPWLDHRRTCEQLGYRPRPLDEAILQTSA
jgi:hypothetical protein